MTTPMVHGTAYVYTVVVYYGTDSHQLSLTLLIRQRHGNEKTCGRENDTVNLKPTVHVPYVLWVLLSVHVCLFFLCLFFLSFVSVRHSCHHLSMFVFLLSLCLILLSFVSLSVIVSEHARLFFQSLLFLNVSVCHCLHIFLHSVSPISLPLVLSIYKSVFSMFLLLFHFVHLSLLTSVCLSFFPLSLLCSLCLSFSPSLFISISAISLICMPSLSNHSFSLFALFSYSFPSLSLYHSITYFHSF